MVTNNAMGKKHKTRDIWDLSPEEQSKQAEDIFAIESGKFDILTLAKTTKGVNSRGFSHGLESEITKDIMGKKNTTVNLNEEPEPSGKTNMEELIGVSPKKNHVEEDSQQISIDEPEQVYTMPFNIDKFTHTQEFVKILPDANTSRSISFNVINGLNRLIVNDGISPTSFSFDVGMSQELVNSYDTDDIGDMTVDLFTYVISLKHPTAIYEYDDFINRDFWKFGSVSNDNYDHNKYVFLEANGYVYCYLIDTDSVDYFYNYINDSQMDKDDILRTFVSLAYAAGTMQQAFFIEEDTYVRSFMRSEFNNQKEFHTIFVDDLSTKLVPNGKDVSDEDGINLLSAEDIQSYVREMISRVTGTSYFGDEDDWDDVDDSDDDDDTVDDGLYELSASNEDSNVGNEDTEPIDIDGDDVSELLSDNMEVVPDNESAESEPQGEFVVDVIRKK